MIKKIFSAILLLGFALIFALTVKNMRPAESLIGVSEYYATREAKQLGAMNLVTAIVVTYRGLDTLGEVSVLFIAATGIAVLLRRKKEHEELSEEKREASPILYTGVRLLAPLILMFGVYIFLNGHLSPGGGFQGGAVVASTILLFFLVDPAYRLNHKVFGLIESISGASYVAVGVLGIFFAGGFLDNRILPLGEFGKILSAGAIPVIYVLIGLKVGTELASILDNMKGKLE